MRDNENNWKNVKIPGYLRIIIVYFLTFTPTYRYISIVFTYL